MTHSDQHRCQHSPQASDALVGRARKRLVVALLLLALIVALSQTGATWAQPHQNSLRSSVPTRVSSATPGPTSTPSPTVVPGVTRVVLQDANAEDPGYHGTEDTYIDSNIPRLPTTQEGNLRLKGAGGQSVLIRFDLEGQVPAGAQVQAAELVFYVEHPIGTVPHDLGTGAFRVLQQWSEQEASWRYRHSDARLAWDTEGCNGPGVDRAETDDDNIVLSDRAVYKGFDVTDSVQYMLDNPEENFGWVVMGTSASTGSFSLAASRNRNPDQRPALRIDYVDGGGVTETATPTPTVTTSVGATPTATPQGASILVRVYNDIDQDGAEGSGEPGIEGVTIELLDYATRDVLQTAITGVDGTCLFDSLTAPYYRLREVNPTGVVSTTPDEIRVSVGGGQSLALFGDHDPTLPTATLTPTPTLTPGPEDAEISVVVCDDANGNGLCDAGEEMADVPVVLSDANGTPLDTQMSDAQGAVAWQGLARACYEVYESLPFGYYAVGGPLQLRCVDAVPASVTFVNQMGTALGLPLIIR